MLSMTPFTRKNQVGQDGEGINGGEFARKTYSDPDDVREQLLLEFTEAKRRLELTTAKILAEELLEAIPEAANVELDAVETDSGRVSGWFPARVFDEDMVVLGEFDGDEFFYAGDYGHERPVQFDAVDIGELFQALPSERPALIQGGAGGFLHATDPDYAFLDDQQYADKAVFRIHDAAALNP